MSLIKSVPKSDATNVYDLLQDVKQAITEEPKRVNMSVVARNVSGIMYGYSKPNKAGTEMKWCSLEKPACGTVGCFAGWVQMLAGRHPDVANGSWTEGAFDVLGAGLIYRFDGPKDESHTYDTDERRGIYNVFNWGAGDGILKLKPGTRAYARAVCRRIDGFIERNGGKAVLQAKPITRQDSR